MYHIQQRGVTKVAKSEPKILSAFSVDNAARVTDISKARLTRWDRLGLFSPEYVGDDDRRNPYARVYSFVDLVGLRTLKILADKHRVPMAELKTAATELKKWSDRPWSSIPLAVVKRRVVFDLAVTPRDSGGQLVLRHIPLAPIAEEIARKAHALSRRDASQLGQTEKHKFVQHNAEVVSGTRIPVAAVESFVRAGYSNSQIIEEYPSLATRDIKPVRVRLRDAA